MSQRKLREIEQKIDKIKNELQHIDAMRPGSLTRQYRNKKEKVGPFWQISYTHKMKSHTNYVRRESLSELRKQIKNYKKFKRLVTSWVALSIQASKLILKSSSK